MTLTIFQRFLILVIRVGITVIWFFDALSGLSAKSTLVVARNALLFLISAGFIAFLGFSYGTGYLEKVADGVYYSMYPPISSGRVVYTPTQVLGARSVKGDLPRKVAEVNEPELSAVSVLVQDLVSGKTLYEHNSNIHLAPASTTKLMTALVSVDLYNLEDELTVPETCTKIDSTKDWLPADSVFRVKDLLYSTLVSSAGDAACVLATGKVSYNDFVYRMNSKASQLGMRDTYFTNPIGLDGIANSHYSTAEDLSVLAQAAMLDQAISSVVRTKEYVVKSVGEEHIFNIQNTNRLLWEVPQTVGVKTGTTEEAGEVLIYEYQDEVKELLIIVMGSDDRFSDTRALLSWVFSSYSWDE